MNKIVIGNLKMNLISPIEREQYLKSFQKELDGRNLDRTDLVLCPSVIHLEAFKNIPNVALGAQNFFWERKGSFTGEISIAMLKNFGCKFAIVGHSERRKYFRESDKEINLKILSALKVGIDPILCVGETKSEKDSNQTLSVISRQLKSSLVGVSNSKAEKIIVAYEPVWAVGSDKIPDSNQIMEAKVLIRKILFNFFGERYARKIKIIYGGSVSHLTVKQTCLDSAMDGALIGRESLVPYEFLKISEIING
jgi:triosephosphate isomerase (TIM)